VNAERIVDSKIPGCCYFPLYLVEPPGDAKAVAEADPDTSLRERAVSRVPFSAQSRSPEADHLST
jgi:hypothetical protein